MSTVKNEKTRLRDNEPSMLHRTLGMKLYETDLDVCEYIYLPNGKTQIVAIIDEKFPTASMAYYEYDKSSSIQVQVDLANQINVSAFICKSYLDDRFPVKMKFVIPLNNIAKKLFKDIYKKDASRGKWMSILNYSRFLHFLHKQPNDLEAQKLLSSKYKEYL